jgi:hypothetical protein
MSIQCFLLLLPLLLTSFCADGVPCLLPQQLQRHSRTPIRCWADLLLLLLLHFK